MTRQEATRNVLLLVLALAVGAAATVLLWRQREIIELTTFAIVAIGALLLAVLICLILDRARRSSDPRYEHQRGDVESALRAARAGSVETKPARTLRVDRASRTGTARRIFKLMRVENPEIWQRIDELERMGARLDDLLDRVEFPRGNCFNCKYDLTGNVSGICPEFGEPTDQTPLERSLRSIHIYRQVCQEYPDLAAAIREREERERQRRRDEHAEKEGHERDRRRKRAFDSYLERKRTGGANSA